MKLSRSSASAIIIVSAVVIMAGGLGWYLGQNYAADAPETVTRSDDTKQDETALADNVSHKKGSISDVFDYPLSFQYPDDWTQTSTIDGPQPLDASKGNTQQAIKLTAPDGSIYVTYKVAANGGLGGACDSMDSGVIGLAESTEITDLTVADFVEYTVIDRPDGREFWVAGLASTEQVGGLVSGVNQCDMYLSGVIGLRDSDSLVILDASIHLSAEDSLWDISAFESARKTETYHIAKQILLSTTNK